MPRCQARATARGDAVGSTPPGEPPSLELGQLQDAWQRTILPGRGAALDPDRVDAARSTSVAARRRHADPRVPGAASFHRQLAEDQKNSALLVEALYEVTGRKLALEFAVGENGGDTPAAPTGPAGEEQIFELMKETFDAHEVEDRQ